jgi:hypothetical protein
MARGGIGPIIPDRVAAKPAPVAAKPAATPAKSADQMEREALAKAAQIKKDQASSAAAFKASGLGAAGFISMTDSKAASAAKAPAPEKTIFSTPQTSSSNPQTPKSESSDVRLSTPANMDPGGAFSPSVPSSPVEATPPQPVPLVSKERQPVKYATPEDVLTDINELPIDLILKLTLEKIGGLELISLVRHDTVNGQNIIYRPVKNISQLAIDYNPQNMIKMPDSADSYFKNFAIKLENHIPQTTNDLTPVVVYIDPTTKNVIIDVVNIKADYEVEVQMVSSGKVFDATIYIEES